MDAEYKELELIPKTRAGADHHGKPGIYFTGYPEDIVRYFDGKRCRIPNGPPAA